MKHQSICIAIIGLFLLAAPASHNQQSANAGDGNFKLASASYGVGITEPRCGAG
jgi:hypothetical protein